MFQQYRSRMQILSFVFAQEEMTVIGWMFRGNTEVLLLSQYSRIPKDPYLSCFYGRELFKDVTFVFTVKIHWGSLFVSIRRWIKTNKEYINWGFLSLNLTLRVLMSYIYMEHPFLMFLDHTQRRNTVGRTPLDEWSARRRDLYLTTHDTHNRQISMPPGGNRTHDLSRRAAAVLWSASCTAHSSFRYLYLLHDEGRMNDRNMSHVTLNERIVFGCSVCVD